MVPSRPDVGIEFLAGFLTAHIVTQQRHQFREAMLSQDSLTIDELFELVDPTCRAVYDGLSFRSISAVLGLWPERRHLHHGRLLAAGRPRGAAGLTLYDVFCLLWAELDVAATAGEFNAVNWKGGEDLRAQIMGLQGRAGDAKSDVEELRALVERDRGSDA